MEGQDFFPLTVEYRERAYAGGRIPGGYFKREGAPVKKETLTCRLIDRPIRPLFPDGFRNEIQVICLVISADPENDPDVLAMIGASAALCLSGIPFDGPGRRGAGGPGRRPARRQPDLRQSGGLAARARDGGHRGRRPDGRGGRQGSLRGARCSRRSPSATSSASSWRASRRISCAQGRQAALGLRRRRRRTIRRWRRGCRSWPRPSWLQALADPREAGARRGRRAACSTRCAPRVGVDDDQEGRGARGASRRSRRPRCAG